MAIARTSRLYVKPDHRERVMIGDRTRRWSLSSLSATDAYRKAIHILAESTAVTPFYRGSGEERRFISGR
jgi:hypothetical protein